MRGNKMKKAAAVLLAASAVISAGLMSGCDDFKFNPVGKWRFTDEILSNNDVESKHLREDDMVYKDTIYSFGKTGKGNISVQGTEVMEFTYDYSDDTVILHLWDPEKKLGITDITYKLGENSTGKKTLTRTDTEYDKNEKGEVENVFKHQFVLTKE